MKLCYQVDRLEVIGFSNSDFAGDRDDCKSTSGHVFLFGGVAISWSSKKQSCVTHYTQEAEYVTYSIATTFVG